MLPLLVLSVLALSCSTERKGRSGGRQGPSPEPDVVAGDVVEEQLAEEVDVAPEPTPCNDSYDCESEYVCVRRTCMAYPNANSALQVDKVAPNLEFEGFYPSVVGDTEEREFGILTLADFYAPNQERGLKLLLLYSGTMSGG